MHKAHVMSCDQLALCPYHNMMCPAVPCHSIATVQQVWHVISCYHVMHLAWISQAENLLVATQAHADLNAESTSMLQRASNPIVGRGWYELCRCRHLRLPKFFHCRVVCTLGSSWGLVSILTRPSCRWLPGVISVGKHLREERKGQEAESTIACPMLWGSRQDRRA